MRHFVGRAANQLEHERVAAFVFDAGLIFIGINRVAGLIEIFGTDVERLVNVADIVREQNYRDRLGDFARIIFRDVAAQNIDAIANHVDDVPLGPAGRAAGIFVNVENRHIGVVEPVM